MSFATVKLQGMRRRQQLKQHCPLERNALSPPQEMHERALDTIDSLEALCRKLDGQVKDYTAALLLLRADSATAGTPNTPIGASDGSWSTQIRDASWQSSERDTAQWLPQQQPPQQKLQPHGCGQEPATAHALPAALHGASNGDAAHWPPPSPSYQAGILGDSTGSGYAASPRALSAAQKEPGIGDAAGGATSWRLAQRSQIVGHEAWNASGSVDGFLDSQQRQPALSELEQLAAGPLCSDDA